MNSKLIESKWWFAAPVAIGAGFTVVWLFTAVGLNVYWLKPWSFPRFILFFVSFYSFRQFYSYVLRIALFRYVPAATGKNKLTS